MSANPLDRNVVVLGGMGVGKSTAIQRFLGNEFTDRYQPTVKNSYNKKVTVNGVEYNLTITDTAGQDETTLLDTLYVRSADVYVIAFSVVSQRSLEITQVIRDKILDMTGTETVAMVLVGNKNDLKDERQVSKEEAETLAKAYGCPYIETSAKENFNIDEVFFNSVKIANKARAGDTSGLDGSMGADDKSACIVM